MFSTIVEKVEEEETAGIETSRAPESPLTPFYDSLTLKARSTWPSFLGDWAFVNGTHKARGGTSARSPPLAVGQLRGHVCVCVCVCVCACVCCAIETSQQQHHQVTGYVDPPVVSGVCVCVCVRVRACAYVRVCVRAALQRLVSRNPRSRQNALVIPDVLVNSMYHYEHGPLCHDCH